MAQPTLQPPLPGLHDSFEGDGDMRDIRGGESNPDEGEVLVMPEEKMTTLDRIQRVASERGFIPLDSNEASVILLIEKEPGSALKPVQYLDHVFHHQQGEGVSTDKSEAALRNIVHKWGEHYREANNNPVFVRELEDIITDSPQLSVAELLEEYPKGVAYANRVLKLVKTTAVLSRLVIQEDVPEDIQKRPYAYVDELWEAMVEDMTLDQLKGYVQLTDSMNSLRKVYWKATFSQARFQEATKMLVSRTMNQQVE